MIEVRTILNPQSVRKFHSYMTKSRSWIGFTLLMLFYISAFVTLIMGVKYWVTIILAVAGTACPFLYLLIAKSIGKKVDSLSDEFNDERTQVWRFFGDRILFNESGKGIAARDRKFDYDDISKVKEVQEAFYIYIGSEVFMLDAKGFSVGGRKELHDCLIDYVGSRRYSYSKKIYSQK